MLDLFIMLIMIYIIISFVMKINESQG